MTTDASTDYTGPRHAEVSDWDRGTLGTRAARNADEIGAVDLPGVTQGYRGIDAELDQLFAQIDVLHKRLDPILREGRDVATGDVVAMDRDQDPRSPHARQLLSTAARISTANSILGELLDRLDV